MIMHPLYGIDRLKSPLILTILFVLLALQTVGCGGSSDGDGRQDDEEPETFDVEIEDNYPGVLSAADETQLAVSMAAFSRHHYKAIGLINSVFFADLSQTSLAVLQARIQASASAIQDTLEQAAMMQHVELNVLIPAVDAAARLKKTAQLKARDDDNESPFQAKKLVDLYLSDPDFRNKYSLSDIAGKTGLSLKRVVLLLSAAQYELDNATPETEAAVVDRMKTLRDTLGYAAMDMNVHYLMEEAAAGVGTYLGGKLDGWTAVENADTVMSVQPNQKVTIASEYTPAVLVTDEDEYEELDAHRESMISIFSMLDGDFGSPVSGRVVAFLASDPLDIYGRFIHIEPDNIQVSDAKIDDSMPDIPNLLSGSSEASAISNQLPAGDYLMPTGGMQHPNAENSGFAWEADNTLNTEEELEREQQKVLDLIDSDIAVTDFYAWNPDLQNPIADFQPVHSEGPAAGHGPMSNDTEVNSQNLSDVDLDGDITDGDMSDGDIDGDIGYEDGDVDDDTGSCSGPCDPQSTFPYCAGLNICACSEDGKYQLQNCNSACVEAGHSSSSGCGQTGEGYYACTCED